jgi:hypothetical protein
VFVACVVVELNNFFIIVYLIVISCKNYLKNQYPFYEGSNEMKKRYAKISIGGVLTIELKIERICGH